jgi:hypothetical protein
MNENDERVQEEPRSYRQEDLALGEGHDYGEPHAIRPRLHLIRRGERVDRVCYGVLRADAGRMGGRRLYERKVGVREEKMDEHIARFASSWVGSLLSAIDAEVDPATRDRIFAECARGCTDHWAQVAAEVRASSGESDDVDTLLARFAERLPGGADLSRQGDLVRWRFTGPSCPCPVARLAPQPGICECSVAHVRGMLEPLLGRSIGRPLGVELLRSRLRGAEDCLFVARL